MLCCRHTPVGLGPRAEAGVPAAAAWGIGKVPSEWDKAIAHPHLLVQSCMRGVHECVAHACYA